MISYTIINKINIVFYNDKIVEHFIQLSESDKRMRFGMPIKNEAIISYVKNGTASPSSYWVIAEWLDPFNVFEKKVVGVGHLYFDKENNSEIGLSISDGFKRRGIGSNIMSFSIILSNLFLSSKISGLTLRSNKQMISLAKKMNFDFEGGGTSEIEAVKRFDYNPLTAFNIFLNIKHSDY